MSTHLHVYVGPFLKCYPAGRCCALDADELCELRGEAVHDEDLPYDCLGPNIPCEGIDRQWTYEKHSANRLAEVTSVSREMALFEAKFAHAINEIRGDYDRIEVSWGIVPGYF